MELVLLRHGKAEPHGHPQGDAARQLVERGRQQARSAARRLALAGRLPDLVLASPLARALQTAEEFCTEVGLEAPLVQAWLACGMAPADALAALAGFSEFERVMIVGHEPDFSHLATTLLGATGGAVEVKKGALAGFRIEPPSTRGELRFLIPPVLA